MINSLKIKNIQSHKNSELHFVPGINCIIGSSNNGKSAILRALNWAIYNRPLGIDVLCSHWALDKKDKQIAEMSVTVEKDEGVLVRRKSSGKNEYQLDEEVLEAVRTDVPEQVSKFFNLGEVNVQRQLDAPFLLSLSSGEVAKFFNKTVRLDVIDRVLTNAEQTRRKTKSAIEQGEELVSDYKSKLEKYDWLPKVEKLLKKYENVESRNNELRKQVEELSSSIEKYRQAELESKKYSDFNKQKKLITEIEKSSKSNEQLENRIHNLEDEIETFNDISKKKCNYDFSSCKKIISKIESYDNSKLKEQIESLSDEIETVLNGSERMISNEEKISQWNENLPQVCPLCGNPMNNGVCKNEKK